MFRKIKLVAVCVRARARRRPPPPTADAAELELVEQPADRFERAIETHRSRSATEALNALEARRRSGAQPARDERLAGRAARRACRARAADRAAQAEPEFGLAPGVSQATLDAIAACESGGDPTAVNAAGYYGKYQFDTGTWASVGGSGNPAEASRGRAGLPRLAALQPRRLLPLAGLRLSVADAAQAGHAAR